MKKKTHPQWHASRVALAALIGVVAIPTAMTGLFQSIDDDGINTVPVVDMRQNALNDAARVRAVRRNYWRAVDVYNELVRLGYTNLVPPRIYDTESIHYYLDPENFAGMDGAQEVVFSSAPVEGSDEYVAMISDAEAEYNALPERYRDLLDGYIATSRCPGSLRQYHLAGFYDLCTRLLDEHLAQRQPNLFDRSAYLRGFQPVGFAPLRNLRNRLQSLQESLLFENGTSVRPRTHDTDGFRPSLRE